MSVMFLIASQECGVTLMITISLKLVILPKEVYYRETQKHTKKKKKRMAGSIDALFVIYIRTTHLTKHSSNCFQELKTMSKTTHVKKVIEYRYVFRSEFKVRIEVNDGIQTSISHIKDELQNSTEKNVIDKTRNEK